MGECRGWCCRDAEAVTHGHGARSSSLSGTTKDHRALRPASGVYDSIAIADFNNDGKPDVVANNESVGVTEYLGNGDGTR